MLSYFPIEARETILCVVCSSSSRVQQTANSVKLRKCSYTHLNVVINISPTSLLDERSGGAEEGREGAAAAEIR